MRLVSFDPFRTLGIPGVRSLRPDSILDRIDEVRAADWVLFPEYWQVDILVHALGKRIFPSPATHRLGHDKVQMTRAFRAAFPAHVPETLILPGGDGAAEQVLERMGLPIVAKEVRSSMGRGVALVETRRELREWAARVDVLYVQERLSIDRDLRVVWIGDRVEMAYWRAGPPGAFHHNVSRGGRMIFEDVPAAALEFVARVARTLDIDHAGFDIAIVDGHPYLLEFNVRFGNLGHEEHGLRAPEVIYRYLMSRSAPLPGTDGGPRALHAVPA